MSGLPAASPAAAGPEPETTGAEVPCCTGDGRGGAGDDTGGADRGNHKRAPNPRAASPPATAVARRQWCHRAPLPGGETSPVSARAKSVVLVANVTGWIVVAG